ncbi:hypothetical protein VUR80DRAFT_9093 [Thermomyces stellatus]
MADSRPPGDPASVGIPPLLQHLSAVLADPSAPLETALFERVHTELAFYSLPFADNQQTYHTLLTHLISALPSLPTDDAVLTVTSLIDALTTRMPISAVLSFVRPEMLVAALDAPHPAANLLALDIARRAEGKEGARSVLRADVLRALVMRWMYADAVEVGQRGEEALVNLLEATRADLVGAARRLSIREVNEEVKDGVNGTAYPPLDIWEYLLEGEGGDIIRRACATGPNSRQTSIAQNRLLGLLPKVAHLDFDALASSQGGGPNNLLNYAVDVVDREDIAMYLILVQFYKDLFHEVYTAPAPTTRASFAALVAGRSGDTAAVRAVEELRREALADEELAEFGEWVTSVVGDA